jgi:O-methyltransferase
MVYVATRTGYTMVVHHLIELGISEEKINTEYCFSNNHARTSFLEMFAQYAEKHNLPGIIAEIGVFQGEFSVIINEAFPLRELHLFDTFEGFDERDIKYEYANGLTKQRIHTFKDTSIDLVRKRLPNAHNVVFHKGYFPETFDLYKEQFLFVSLDVDLYLPTKSGLELFYPLLVKNGVMLIDDYFSGTYPAIRKVVDEFCTEHNISALPIGDRYGIAIVK